MKTICFFVFALLSTQSFSQYNITIGSTDVEVDTVFYGLDIPWEITYGPDGFIWTTERYGVVSRIDPVAKTKTVILDISATVFQDGESGLLGMTLHPDFANTPEVFLAYTYGNFGNSQERIVKYTYNGSTLINETILLDNIPANTTHIGCRLMILPDNTLLITTGDAQNLALPQDVNSLAGKVLRINLDGTIPANNPIPGNPMYSFGHRNAQGLAEHPNGMLYISEHGAFTDDEFQYLEVNRNYGWPNVEGFCDTGSEPAFCSANNVLEPLVAWTPTIAPSDLVYYSNPPFPEFHDRMLMTVLKDKRIIAMQLSTDGLSVTDEDHYLINQFGRLRDICIGPNNEIYLATNGESWTNTNPNTHSIMVLRPLSNVGLPEADKGFMRIHPNPAEDIIHLEISSEYLNGELTLTDSFGKVIYSRAISALASDISTAKLAHGLYFLKISNETSGRMMRVLVK